MATRLPSLRSIETFLCVSEVLNFRLASERLHVTVSAISHRIQVLEQELGVQLLDRSRRRLRLTGEGEALLERLRPGVALLQDATSLTRDKVARPLLRIAAPPAFNAWLLSALGPFHARRPDLRLELQSTSRRRAAGVDVTILPMNAASQRDGARMLAPIRVAPVCSPAFRDAHRIETPFDLLKVPLIDTIPSLRIWKDWFLAAGVHEEIPAASLALDNHALIYAAAMEGHGAAIGMRSLLAGYLAQGRLVELFSVSCEFGPPLGLLVNENGNVRLAREFADWLAECIGEHDQFLATPASKS